MDLLLDPIDQRIDLVFSGDRDLLAVGAERTRLVKIVLDHAKDGHRDPSLGKCLPDGSHVSASSVQKNQVGKLGKRALAILQMLHSAAERLAHGGVVVGSVKHRTNGEAAIIGLGELSLAADDHARREMLLAEIGNIVCLDPRRIGLKPQKLRKACKRSLRALGIDLVALGLLGGVLVHHFAERAQSPPLGNANHDPMPRKLAQVAREQVGLLRIERNRKQDLRRNVLTQAVMLAQKRAQILRLKQAVRPKEELGLVLKHARADVKNGYAGAKLVAVKPDHVLLGRSIGHHLLLFPDRVKRANSVAATRGRLVSLLLRKAEHLLLKRAAHVRSLSSQNIGSVANRNGVFLGRNASRTNAHAPPHLVIDAGTSPADVARKNARAGGQTQTAVDPFDQGKGRGGSRIRAEIAPLSLLSLTGHLQARVFPLRDADIGIRLCILEANVVLRRVLLDQGILQRKRLHLVVAEIVVKIPDLRHHACRFDILFAILKILRNAVLELARLANVDHAALTVAHHVDARTKRKRVGLLQKGLTGQHSLCHSLSFPTARVFLTERNSGAPRTKPCPQIHTAILFIRLLDFRKSAVDQLAKSGDRSVLILPVGKQSDSHSLCNPHGKHAQKALGIDLSILFFDPDRALICIRLLNEEGSRSCVQAAGIDDRYIA